MTIKAKNVRFILNLFIICIMHIVLKGSVLSDFMFIVKRAKLLNIG